MADTVLGERMERQGLASRAASSSVAAAQLGCGLQAQDAAAARLGVRARCAAATDASVTADIADARTVTRAWLMRSTIHLVPSADVPWLLQAFGPMIRRRFSSVRWPELGLTPDLLARAETAAADVLHGATMTRHELVRGLVEAGVPVPADGQAPTHLVLYLATTGLLCHAADRGRDSTFALVSDWLPDAPAGPRGDDALAELARRFFTSFSPATAADFTAWSGLPSSRAVALIRDELAPVDVFGRPGFRLGTVEPRGGVRLLGAFDNYLIGYRDRTPMLRPEVHGDVFVGGIIRPTVLLDGRVIGRWRQLRRASSVDIEVTAYESFSRARRAAVDAEAADLARFLGTPTSLTVLDA